MKLQVFDTLKLNFNDRKNDLDRTYYLSYAYCKIT